MKEKIIEKIDNKTKPKGSLGKLEHIALQIASVQKTLSPVLKNPTIIVFAADHGIADEGVSAFPKELTFKMVLNFLNGGAAINVFCRQNGIRLKIVDAGVGHDFPEETPLINAKIGAGTKNILNEPAMSIESCKAAMDKGRDIVINEYRQGCNIIGFGEMGIGNTSSASLLMSSFTGIDIEECVGRGTGHDEAGLAKKTEILKRAAQKYDPVDPLEILATFGGFEITMMCGAMLEAKKRNMIIPVDGFVSTSAFLAANAFDNTLKQNAIFCHSSDEKGHKAMLNFLGVEAVCDLGMRLGEGSGIAVVFPVIQSAVNFLNEMSGFEDAGIDNK